MNFSALSIRNPAPAVLLFGLLTLMGLYGFHKLSIQNMPDVEFPIVMVNASLEGAAPSQLETEVARKLEDQIATVSGIKHINTTVSDGRVTVAIEFELEKNGEEALDQVRSAVDSVRPQLPAAMQPPMVTRLTTSGMPIVTYTVQSAKMSEAELTWFVDNDVAKAMRAVSGVGEFKRIGGIDREVLVELDPARLAGLGVTPAAVAARLGAVQRDLSGGEGRVAGQNQSIRTLGAAATTAEIAALPIPLGDGRQVRLEQVARVRDSFGEKTSYALMDGKPVIAFQITRTRGAGEVAVASAVKEAVAGLQKRHPGVTISEAYNTVRPIMESYQGSMHMLYEGALLAVLVVFLFLKDWRATFVSAAALPLSIIPAFYAMHIFGFSLNMLTLLSLALIVGILVDDAIVEVENIVRHQRMGKQPKEAATDAAAEIGLAVIATTFSLVAVFLPTAFMAGIPGRFFRQFGITAAMAILASLLVARLITPVIAAYLLKNNDREEKDGRLMGRYLAWARWCLEHRARTVALALAFMAGSFALVPLLPSAFVPAGDRSQTTATLELPPGSRLDDTRATVEQAIRLLGQVSDVKKIFATVGGGDVRTATLVLDLTPRSERSYKQTAIETRIRQALETLPGARVKLGSGGNGEQLQVVLAGENPQTLATASSAVERDLRTLDGVGAVTSAASLQRPEIRIKPDFARAAELGVTSAALASAVRLATYGDYQATLGKLNLPERQVDVRVRLAGDVRQDLAAIGQIRVEGAKGLVPLGSIAQITIGDGPSEIVRRDRQRQTTINVELAGRTLGDVMAEANRLPSLQNLPPGVFQMKSGEAERMAEVFGSFAMAMLTGVACIYIVLVLLFKDFLQPATILAALPLSAGGAFLALLLAGASFSLPSIMGLLMLMGVVSKNSILLVEYAIMARREKGLGRLDALMDACHKRSRPIVMTTVAMVAGMIPIALGFGAADPSFRGPMAVAVIGGLTTSTFLSLLVIPVVYTYVDDLLVWLRKLMNRER